MCLNAHHEPIDFTLPPAEFGPSWVPVIDTATATGRSEDVDHVDAGGSVTVEGRATRLFRAVTE